MQIDHPLRDREAEVRELTQATQPIVTAFLKAREGHDVCFAEQLLVRMRSLSETCTVSCMMVCGVRGSVSSFVC